MRKEVEVTKMYEKYRKKALGDYLRIRNLTPVQFFLEAINKIAYSAEEKKLIFSALKLVIKEMSREKGYVRDDGSDYYNHPIEVANILIIDGIQNADILTIALLHDILEDVQRYSKISLQKRFGNTVAKNVEILSKKKSVDYHEAYRLQEYLYDISESEQASVVKTADRIHNLLSLERRSPEKIHKKMDQTIDAFLPFFTKCVKKYPNNYSLFYKAIQISVGECGMANRVFVMLSWEINE